MLCRKTKRGKQRLHLYSSGALLGNIEDLLNDTVQINAFQVALRRK